MRWEHCTVLTDSHEFSRSQKGNQFHQKMKFMSFPVDLTNLRSQLWTLSRHCTDTQYQHKKSLNKEMDNLSLLYRIWYFLSTIFPVVRFSFELLLWAKHEPKYLQTTLPLPKAHVFNFLAPSDDIDWRCLHHIHGTTLWGTTFLRKIIIVVSAFHAFFIFS